MSAIQFIIGSTSYTGTITTVEKENEFQYVVTLNNTPPFTIHLSDDGYWMSNTPNTDPLIILAIGDFIENMEDLGDVLSELNTLRN